MGLGSYKSRPDEAVRLGIAACAAAGIKLDVDLRLVALACRYGSGTAKSPDYDLADAFVALCTPSPTRRTAVARCSRPTRRGRSRS